jgi:hypothetical protein
MRALCFIAFCLLPLGLFPEGLPAPEKESPAISVTPKEPTPSIEPPTPIAETKPTEAREPLPEIKPVEPTPLVEVKPEEPQPPLPLAEAKPAEPPAMEETKPEIEIPSARIPLLLPVIEPKPVQPKPVEKAPPPPPIAPPPAPPEPTAVKPVEKTPVESKAAPAKPLEPKPAKKKQTKTPAKKPKRPHRKPKPIHKPPMTTPPARLPLFIPMPSLLHHSKEPTPPNPNKPSPPKFNKIHYPIPKRLTLSHNTGYGEHSGVYQGSNYTTFGVLLASDYTAGAFFPLIDLRANRFDNDTYAFNIGAGGRYILANHFCEILGFNMFYDWRQGSLNEYNQLSLGLEILGRRWDFRANGYFPVGAKKYQLTCNYQYEGGYEITHQRHEITTYGFNAEVGYLAVASKNFLFYTAAGPYYLTRNSCCFEPIRGGRVRVRPQYKDYIALDASYSYDSNFNSVWELTFIVYLPLYQITNQNERPCRLTDRQIYQPIERFEIMPLGNRSCWQTNF